MTLSSTPRAALRAAVDARAGARAARDAATAAVERGREAQRKAESAVFLLGAAVDAGTRDQAEAVRSAIATGAELPPTLAVPPALLDKRARFDEASARLGAVRAALKLLEADRDAAQREFDRATAVASNAALAVMREEVADVVTALAGAQAAVMRLRRQVRAAASVWVGGRLAPDLVPQRGLDLLAERLDIEPDRPPFYGPHPERDAVASWSSFHDALLANPAATIEPASVDG